MRRYRWNIEVKQNFDKLQSLHECCGDNKYTDWFRVSWVSNEFVDTSDPEIRNRVRSGSDYKSDDVPFSCCDRAARRPCITKFIHENDKHFNYDYQVSTFSVIFDPETDPQALPTLFLLLFLGLLLSDLQSTKAFSFHNRSSLNFACRLKTLFSTIAP